MAILYRLVCDRRQSSPYRGQWFARAVNLGTVETGDLARKIERNCSVKRSDVLAVLTELGEVIREELAASHRVRIEGIGSLMAGISNRCGADSPEAFVPDNIGSLHLCFTPERDLLPPAADTAPLSRL